MSGKHGLTGDYAKRILGESTVEQAAARLRPDTSPPAFELPAWGKVSNERAFKAFEKIQLNPEIRHTLLDRETDDLSAYQGNIENAIGLLKLPIGIAGPLRVNGLSAKGDFPVPLATTEAALVASYHRGCRAITAAGGCSAMVLYESISRAPAFVFESSSDACRFVVWAVEHFDSFKKTAESTTSHGKLIDLGCTVEGNHVYANFEYTTGDAGWTDPEGRVWLLGRASEKLPPFPSPTHLPDEALNYPFAIECALREAFPGTRTAALGFRSARCLVIETDNPELEDAARKLGMDHIMRVEKIPLDRSHNAKTDYPALRALLQNIKHPTPTQP